MKTNRKSILLLKRILLMLAIVLALTGVPTLGNGAQLSFSTVTVEAAAKLTAPTISSITNASKGVKLKWKKVSKATGYYVYRKTSSGSWKKIKTIKKNTTVSYTDTSAKNGTTYSYKVKAYSGKTTKSSSTRKMTRVAVPTVSSLVSKSCVSLTAKVTSTAKMSGYQIQYSTSKSFGSSATTVKLSNGKSASKTVKKLTTGKKYYVRARAYKTVSGKKYYSAWSSAKSVKISSTHSYKLTKTVAATCTADGYKKYTCSTCGASYKTTLSATGHTKGSWETTKKATCTTAGTKVKKCTTCGTVTETATIAATGHSYSSAVTKAATCMTAGIRTYTCSSCGDCYTETIAATGHTSSDWVVTKRATCTENGTKRTTCTVCGTVLQTQTIAMTEHTYGYWFITQAATCTVDEIKEEKCLVCDKILNTVTTATAGHAYNSSQVTKEATCAEDGVMTYTCVACGDTYTEAIPATGNHTYSSAVTKEATCTEDGLTTYTCTVCSDTYAETISATGHTSTGKWAIETEATTDAYGTKVIRCATCNEILESKSYAVEKTGSTGINVNWHSQADIIAYLAENPIDATTAVAYDVTPSTDGDITLDSLGMVSDSSLTTALTALNSIRYIAGIDDTVTLDSTYTQYAQGAALINAYYGTLSHYPEQPDSMDNETYAICSTGASSTNIAAGYKNIVKSLLGYMSDSDSSNIARVGHRRWLLNPSMGKTGFGFATTTAGYKYYSATYAFDESNTTASYYGVAWPAQNTPVEYFASTDAWSISMGTSVDSSAVMVTLTRIGDGETWTFSEDSADGYFTVNNDGYGQKGCIIFRPSSISYADGDQFKVVITGLGTTVSYQVNFFTCE